MTPNRVKRYAKGRNMAVTLGNRECRFRSVLQSVGSDSGEPTISHPPEIADFS